MHAMTAPARRRPDDRRAPSAKPTQATSVVASDTANDNAIGRP